MAIPMPDPTRYLWMDFSAPKVVVPKIQIKIARRLATRHAIGARKRRAALKTSSKSGGIRVVDINWRPA